MWTRTALTQSLEIARGTGDDAGVYTFAMPEGDVTVDAEFTQTGPAFSGTALELGGVLNLRFYVTYPDEGWEGAGDAVTFSVNGGAPHTAESRADANGTYYACPVNAFQMADPIAAVYYHGGVEVSRVEGYTIEQNLESLDGTTSGDTRALARAAMDYGCYIQPYLARANHWTVGEDHEEMTAYSEISAESNPAGAYTHQWVSHAAIVTQASYYLTLNDTTTLNVLVKLSSAPTGTITASAGDYSVEPRSMDNNQYLISLPGIPANALGKEYNFTMNVGDEQVFDLKISGLAYVNLVFEYAIRTM